MVDLVDPPKIGTPVMPKPTVVENAEAIRGLLQKGNAARKKGNNNENTKSSRSHALFRIVIDSSPIAGHTDAEPNKTATITFGNFN